MIWKGFKSRYELKRLFLGDFCKLTYQQLQLLKSQKTDEGQYAVPNTVIL